MKSKSKFIITFIFLVIFVSTIIGILVKNYLSQKNTLVNLNHGGKKIFTTIQNQTIKEDKKAIDLSDLYKKSDFLNFPERFNKENNCYTTLIEQYCIKINSIFQNKEKNNIYYYITVTGELENTDEMDDKLGIVQLFKVKFISNKFPFYEIVAKSDVIDLSCGQTKGECSEVKYLKISNDNQHIFSIERIYPIPHGGGITSEEFFLPNEKGNIEPVLTFVNDYIGSEHCFDSGDEETETTITQDEVTTPKEVRCERNDVYKASYKIIENNTGLYSFYVTKKLYPTQTSPKDEYKSYELDKPLKEKYFFIYFDENKQKYISYEPSNL
ncbi:hypothetical protein QEJ31_03140 [Pigmentibacter sp. JX0631]|uniref:hypothetical protein n=1 Tax=Pigmentibacter sp. JX0631 TaxID=2976982 RepID=UPI002468BB87|nr:hypothetical protein [Pigmentibacter sp. JX0631]WGL60596.1 hypothetical protein QEJ31_03140 [Pigmentibacter sp. JX0631]